MNRSPLSTFLDDIARRDLQDVIERLCTISLSRKADAPPGDLSGRTEMKALAEQLARLDCPWPIRELLLNVGRRLYYSTTPNHPYYRDGILDLVRREATPQAAREFEQAVKTLEELSTSAPVFAAADTLVANKRVITLASQVVRHAVEHKKVTFSPSERKLLAGLVDAPTQRLLSK